jgi:hypothetical protein
MAHKFNVGQIVALEPRLLRLSAPGRYEIRHLVINLLWSSMERVTIKAAVFLAGSAQLS